MSKGKNFKYQKGARRQNEIVKAQAKSRLAEYTIDTTQVVDTKASVIKKDSFSLNLKVIRTDLLKTSLYIIFVVVVLIILKSKHLEFNFSFYK